MKPIYAGASVLAALALLVGFGSPQSLARASYPGLFSFRYPSGWSRSDCGNRAVGIHEVGISRLATVKLPPCTGGWPNVRLGRNGIFVAWSLRGMPGLRVSEFGGKPTMIDGHTAHIAVMPHDPGCSPFGSRRAMQAAISRNVRNNVLIAYACIRGPDFGAGEAAVRQMLASIRFPK
jgi:hypothetical protein